MPTLWTKIAFRVSWLLAACFAVVLFGLADVFQDFEPVFPLRPVLVIAFASHVLAAVLSVCSGAADIPGFKVFMPFRGGAPFVTTQALGYASFSAVLVAGIGYWTLLLPSANPPRMRGVLWACAVLSAFGNGLLHYSRKVFDPSASFGTGVSKSRAFGEVLLVFILAGLHAVCGVAAELLPQVRLSASIAGVTVHFACGVLVHVVVGWRYTKGYRLFSPFAGSWRSVFTQATAWTWWSAMLLVGMVLVEHPQIVPRAHALHAVGGVAGNIALLMHTQTMQTHQPSSASFVARDGRFVLSAMSTCISIYVLCTTPFLGSSFGPVLKTTYFVLRVGALAAPPLTHLTGKILHPKHFDLWHPFNHQGRGFLTYQAIGWGTFSLSLVALMFDVRSGDALFSTALLLLAQYGIHASVRVFHPHEQRSAAKNKNKAAATPVVRNELIVASALVTVSLLLRLMCDLLGADTGFPLTGVVWASNAAWFIAVPLAHIAREKRPALFQPFRGSAEYVALQAVGWCFYAVTVVICALGQLDLQFGGAQARARVVGGDAYRLGFTVQGIFMTIPFGLIAASPFFDSETSHRSAGDVRELLRGLSSEDLAALDALAASDLGTPKAPRGVAELLKIVAADARALSRDGEAKEGRSETYKGTAGIIVGCLAMACLIFALAADQLKSVAGGSHSLLLSAASLLLSLATSGVVHSMYGRFLHGALYRRWMPFRGGATFIAWQLVAGTSFGTAVVLFVVAWTHMVFGEAELASITALTPAGLFAAAAPVVTLLSLFYFDEAAMRGQHRPTLFETHAEATVSILIFGVAFGFTAAAERFAEDDNALAAAPLVLGVMSLAVAVPLAIVALRKSAARWAAARADVVDGGDNDSLDGGSLPPMAAAEYFSMALMSMVPLLTGVGLYYASLEYGTEAIAVLHSFRVVIAGVSLLTVLTILARTSFAEWPNAVLDVFAYGFAYFLYSVPTLIIVCVLTVLQLRSIGSVGLLLNIPVLSGPAPVRKLGNMVNIAFVAIQSCRALLAVGRLPLDEVLMMLTDVGLIAACVAYHTTYAGRPEESGTRRSRLATRLFAGTAFRFAQRFFGFRLINSSGAPLCGDDNAGGKQCIFGIHPHGIYPVTAVWLWHSHQWGRVMGCARDVSVHAASILFQIPGLRDVSMAFGCRVVTRRSIDTSLAQGNSTAIIPGGQAELILNAHSNKRLRLVAYHKGFVRVAVDNQKPLVPIFVFGEHNVLDNIHMPKMQSYFLKRFGWGYPVLPMGVLNLPLPNRTKLTVAVGRPIKPAKPQGASGTDAYTDAVEATAKDYFEELVHIFYKHRGEAGYPELELELLHQRP